MGKDGFLMSRNSSPTSNLKKSIYLILICVIQSVLIKKVERIFTQKYLTGGKTIKEIFPGEIPK